ncbi:MAG TPA: hypothetical protein VLL25_18820 [Acidimicrobiales bacterium]|nr:hypothetical protein [Acidimicrobiales bacterium]
MRKLIEYTLVTLDGVFENPQSWGFADYRNDAYLRDGLGLMLGCDAMVMGRHTYDHAALELALPMNPRMVVSTSNNGNKARNP